VTSERLTVAYADPPYIGQSKKHYKDHEDYAGEVDHGALIDRLIADYPDGWALSLHMPVARRAPPDVREGRGLSLMGGDIRVADVVQDVRRVQAQRPGRLRLGARSLSSLSACGACPGLRSRRATSWPSRSR
jgi:hypothetical protein